MSIRPKKHLLSQGLQSAIERYFLVKAANGGSFPDGVEKQRICQSIMLRATGLFGVEIVPGMIVLTDSRGRQAQINSANFSPMLEFRVWEIVK